MTGGKSILHDILPWRYMLFFAILLPACAASVDRMGWNLGLLVGFDIAAVVFLLSCLPMFAHDVDRMRDRARNIRTNPVVMLVLSFLLTILILAAVAVEISDSNRIDMATKLVISGSLILIWIFANTIYMLHYAHLYYEAGPKGADKGGLEFPSTRLPLMSDFAYFAFTLGVAVQTSDVAAHSRHIRNVMTVHCVAGFFFNLGVLALTINVLGS